jgi:hypothetical protein
VCLPCRPLHDGLGAPLESESDGEYEEDWTDVAAGAMGQQPLRRSGLSVTLVGMQLSPGGARSSSASEPPTAVGAGATQCSSPVEVGAAAGLSSPKKRKRVGAAGDARPFACSHPGCGASFKKVGKLNRHEQTHLGVRLFACTFEGCERSYTRSEHLQRHILSHTGEKPFKCEFVGCPMAFSTAHHLKRHTPLHEKSLPFACTVVPGCVASFAKKSQLAAHEARHRGEKACPCTAEGCTEAFDFPSKLKRHFEKKHGPASWICSHTEEGAVACLAAFRTQSELQQHENIAHVSAERFECEICSRSFERYTKLQAHHRKAHPETSGEGPAGTALPRRQIMCADPACHKFFSKKSNMMQHFRSVHEKLKPHACTVQGCDASFSQKYLLARHLERHEASEASGASPGPLAHGPNAPRVVASKLQEPAVPDGSLVVVESVGSGGWLRTVDSASETTDAALLESRGGAVGALVGVDTRSRAGQTCQV